MENDTIYRRVGNALYLITEIGCMICAMSSFYIIVLDTTHSVEWKGSLAAVGLLALYTTFTFEFIRNSTFKKQ